jgi:hypothetical protein
MGLTGFSLCDPNALSSVLRYNIVLCAIIPQSAGEKRVGRQQSYNNEPTSIF